MDDDGDRAELLLELGGLLREQGDDVGRAINAYRRRLDLVPDDMDTAATLGALYREREDWPSLIEMLRIEQAHAESADDNRALCLEIAQVYDGNLNEAQEAVVVYGDVIANFGPDAEALQALARLRREHGQWHELLDVLQSQIDITHDEQERIELEFDVANVLFEHVADRQAASQEYERLLRNPISHDRAQQALTRLVSMSDAPVAASAAQVLASDYRETGQHDALIDVLERIAQTGTPRERVEALVQAAEVYEGDLDNAEQATGYQARALQAGIEESNARQLYEHYRRLATAQQQWSSFVTHVDQAAPRSLDTELRASMYEDIAKIAEEHLKDSDATRLYYEKLAEEKPSHPGAIDALLTLAKARGDDRVHAQYLQRKIAITEDAKTRCDLQIDLATLYESDLDDATSATGCYEDAIGSDPTDARAYAGLRRQYETQRHWEGLRSLYERQIELLVGDPAQVRFDLGQLLKTKFDDPRAALDHWMAALGVDPEHEPSIAALELQLNDESYAPRGS